LQNGIPITNHPNPFTDCTSINFKIKKNAFVELRVYNQQGQLVSTLISEFLNSGNHSIIWDGKNKNGKPAKSGVYFLRLTSEQISQTNKMILVR
jgi:flagellar hook assembly protein FlgD